MKNLFKSGFLALAVSLSFAACSSNQGSEESVDTVLVEDVDTTVVIDTTVTDSVVDTTVVDTLAQ